MWFKRLRLRLFDEGVKWNYKHGYSSCSCKDLNCPCSCLSGGFIPSQGTVQNVCIDGWCLEHKNDCWVANPVTGRIKKEPKFDLPRLPIRGD